LAAFQNFDFEPLKKFSAFVTKVQNNQLWQNFPITRALMRFYEIELNVFGEFVTTHLSLRRNHANAQEKLEGFVSFFVSYLEEHRSTMPFSISNAFAFEFQRFKLTPTRSTVCSQVRLLNEVPPFSALEIAKQYSVAPCTIAFHEIDPTQVDQLLESKSFCESKLSESNQYFIYWWDEFSQVVRLALIGSEKGVFANFPTPTLSGQSEFEETEPLSTDSACKLIETLIECRLLRKLTCNSK
jgi:hypothetical protein